MANVIETDVGIQVSMAKAIKARVSHSGVHG